MVKKITFRGDNIDQVKEFAGDACEIEPVYDNNGVVCGHYMVVKTTDGLVRMKPYDVLIKDVKGGIHLCKE